MDPNEKLCIHDPRSPYFNPPVDPEDFLQEARDNCFCDNCFYGRDAMALEIIALQDKTIALEAFMRGATVIGGNQIERIQALEGAIKAHRKERLPHMTNAHDRALWSLIEPN